jgi:hypothetical protein
MGCWARGGSLAWARFGRTSSAPVARGMGTGLGVLAARGGEVRAAGPTQPSPGHGGRVPRREEKSGGERKGARSPRRRGTLGGTRLRRWCWRGRGEERWRGRETGRGTQIRPVLEAPWAVVPLGARTGGSGKMHCGRWLPDARAQLSRRRWALGAPRAVHAIVGAGRTTAGPRRPARGGGRGGRALGRLGARMWGGRGRPRGWEMGRAHVGPGGEEGVLGRAGGGGREREKGPGVGRPNGPGTGGS